MQSRFRQALVRNNPAIFQGEANLIRVGSTLKLPTFAIVKSTAEETTKPAIQKKQQPTAAQIAVKKHTPVAEPTAVITPDPEDIIGHVVMSIGRTEAVNRGDTRRLARHSKIYTGDTLKTLSHTHAQIRFKDGALLSLRPNTEFLITKYHYNEAEDGSERGIFELIKGGFRTITGAIGRRNKQNYQVKTSVATIGIRGTHYALMLCDTHCTHPDTNKPMQQGLYGGVIDGEIIINNDAGQFSFNNDQYFHLASTAQAPVEQLLPPPVFSASPGIKRSAQHPAGISGKTAPAPSPVIDMFADITPIDHNLQPFNDAKNPVLFSPEAKRAPLGASMLIGLMSKQTSATGATSFNVVSAPITIGVNLVNEILLTDIQLATGATATNVPMYVREASLDSVTGNIIQHQFTTFDANTNQLQPDTFILPSSIGASPLGVNWGRWSGGFIITENDSVIAHTGNIH
jgi:hypothetical protein